MGILGFSIMKMKWTLDVYEKIEANIHQEKIKTFCFSLQQYQSLNWIDSREFVLEGQWYDVVQQKKMQDGYFLIKAFSDQEEKEWISFLFKPKSNSTNSNASSNMHQDLKCSLFQNLILDLKDILKVNDSFIELSQQYSQVDSCDLYPPPRLI
jgi:hypothetical protein